MNACQTIRYGKMRSKNKPSLLMNCWSFGLHKFVLVDERKKKKKHILYCLCLNFFPGNEAGLGTLAGLRASRAEVAWPSPCPVLELIQEKGLRDIAKSKGHGTVESQC